MRPQQFFTQEIVDVIIKLKVVKITDLLKMLNCTAWTLFEKLKDQYLTSYNFNRQYITLKETAEFDVNGIWDYDGIRFSKWVNVEKTIVNIVDKSPSGLSVSEINNILRIRTHNQLHKCKKNKMLVSKRYGRNKVYFSANESIAKSQIMNRNKTMKKVSDESGASVSDVLSVENLHFGYLAQLMLSEALNAEDIYTMLDGMGKPIEHKEIEEIIIRYNLDQKKTLIQLVFQKKSN